MAENKLQFISQLFIHEKSFKTFHINITLSKHFTQTLLQYTLYFVEHTNLFQEIKNYFRILVPKK